MRLERGLRIDRAQQHQALERQPEDTVVRHLHACRAAATGQFGQPFAPLQLCGGLGLGNATERCQRLVQLVGTARLGPGLLTHGGDRFRVQRAQIVSRLRIAPAPREHRLGAALFQRCIVEKGVRARAENLHGQRRRRGQITRQQFNLAALHAPQQREPAFAIHGLVQAVGEGLAYKRMIGNLALADDVFQAGNLVGKDRGQQIVALHSL